MLKQSNRRSRKVLTAAMLLAGAGLAQAQTPGASDVAGSGLAANAADTRPLCVQRAATLVDSGRLIEAKATLERSVNTLTTDDQRAQAIVMLKLVDTKIRGLDPIEVSLQRAELGVQEGDLMSAERWATQVLGKSFAGASEKNRAEAVVKTVTQRRDEVRPLIPGMIEQANKDFAAGDYAAAKSGILAVLRSGVKVDAEVARTLENQQLRIVELEAERGASFDVASAAAPAMLADEQPGHVRRPGQPAEPPAAPAAPAAAEPPAEPAPAPAAPSEPAPAPQPEAAPPPAPAPMVTTPAQPVTSQDDILRTAMRAEGQRIIAEADQSYEAARYAEAADKYEVALRQFQNYLSADELRHAQQRRDEARVRMGSNTSGSLIGTVTSMDSIQRQQAVAEFDNDVAQAKTRLVAGDSDAADPLIASARLAVNKRSNLFTQAELDAYNKQLDELRIQSGKVREDRLRSDLKTREEKAAKDAEEAERTRMTDRDRKVNESIDRIRALQQERKYTEALQVVDTVLFLDPGNPTALLLKNIIGDIVIYERFNSIRARAANNQAIQRLDNAEVTIPPPTMFEFPADWPAKTFQRGEQSAFADPPENRKVLNTMSTKMLPADFQSNKLEDVFNFIQNITQVNMDVEWDTLEAMNVRKDTPISLKLSPLPANVLLDRVLAKAVPDQFSRVGWTVDRGVLTIASQEQLNKNRTLVIYNIQDLLFEIPDYFEVPQIDLNSVLQQSQGGGGGQSPFRGDQQQRQERPDRQERIRQIQDIITANVDFEGWRDNGGETGTMQELNGSLIITNTPKNHREIVGLLSKLREIRNMQINVETKFLLVNQSWFEFIGFDLDVVWNANNNQVRAARANDPSILPSDFFDFSGNAGTGNRGLQRSVTGAGDTTGGGADPITQAVVPPNRGWSPIGTMQNSGNLTAGLARSAVQDDSVTAQVLRVAPALGIAGQFLDDVQVDFLMVATQADRRTVQLTAPRLTFTNGQTANIFVVTQQAFVSDLAPVVGDSAVGFDPTVNVASEGVTMLVEGVISADRRYVTMNIDAGVARIDGFAQQSVSAVAGGQLVNSADTQSFIQLPTITVTRVRTTSTVPDEGTVLLGGQRLVTEVEIETGVPVLSKIPIINRFFTNRLESKEEQTLLILVKPTILIQSEQEENKFPGLLDSARLGISGR
ncbi:MAG: hypothetical protein IT438_06070 [Phycisphaerales bacterium]|nr:hypothetical protein [Phycisphaerales bacterium]